MVKHSQVKKSKKLQKSDRDNGVLQNKVHELLEYIESQFATENRIKKNFAAAALTGALKLLDEISGAEGVSNKKKVELLTKIYASVSERIDGLTRPQTPTPLAHWDQRSDRSILPSAFIVANYPTYGRGLTQAAVRRADRALYQALHREKNRQGWPPDFHLPAIKEQNDLLASDPSINLAGLDELPPSERRERHRVRSARQYRRRKGLGET